MKIQVIYSTSSSSSLHHLLHSFSASKPKTMTKSPFLFSSLSLFLFILLLQRELSEALSVKQKLQQAYFPPRGWNSYDSFSWIISEEEFLQNAKIVSQSLRVHGYQYVVVDYLWYRRKVEGAYSNSLGFDVIDEWGRMIPDPGRWPSSIGGKGFTEIANIVHAMGLKFGIHVMRGISTQAVNANTPILDIDKGGAYEESGRVWRAKDIGLKERTCAWMDNGFMSVDTKSGAGRAFLRSLYLQYAEWGVDFVKNDCVFGDDLDLEQIRVVSEVLNELDRPIVYSLSPGTSVTPAMAADVSNLVNMYRITGDDWDTWEDVKAHFNVTRDFASANMIGAEGLKGKSWPDLDMLPMGVLTDPGSNEGPHRTSKLTLDEQRTQMTLWSMAKSPIMFGGDLRMLDKTTYDIITHPILLAINTFSRNNKEFPYITATNKHKSNDEQSKEKMLDTHILGLTSCKDHNTNSWLIESLDNERERVCWKYNAGSRYNPPFCLYKTKPQFTLDEDMVYEERYKGKLHLLAVNTKDLCLDASHSHKLTSKESHNISFSPCRLNANQMWELNHNGTLVNTYSGLCATLKAKVSSGGIRSWIATGLRGEIIVSVFNLTPEKMAISMKISDLAKALPHRNIKDGCLYREIWSNQHGIAKQRISISLRMHSCALFIFRCI